MIHLVFVSLNSIYIIMLADLEKCIEAFNLEDLKQIIEKLKETETTPQLDRILAMINNKLRPPVPIITPTVSELTLLLNKLETKLYE